VTANYTYDKMERPLNVTVRNGSSKLMSLLYSYNRTGTVLSIRGQVNTVSDTEVYKYDPISRLTNATFNLGGANTTLWYAYDAAGNRLKQSVNGALTSYNYDSRNELTSSSTSGTSITYRYDPDGNLANRTITSGGTTTWTYAWDSAGRLLKVSNGTPQGGYAYDGQGRRVESVESSTIFYSYLGTDTLLGDTIVRHRDRLCPCGRHGSSQDNRKLGLLLPP
jgi:YD repeat-containing protein